MSPPPVKPMLGDLELSLIQRVHTSEERALVKHGVPGMDGAIFQNLGRRPTVVTLTGVLTGEEAPDNLAALRQTFQARQPVPFVADIVTGTRVTQVLMDDLRVQESAGKPQRFEYYLLLREFIPPPPPAPAVSPDALGPFGDLVEAIDSMGRIPDFRDPTPPLLRMLDSFQGATGGLAGILGALSGKLGTPPES